MISKDPNIIYDNEDTADAIGQPADENNTRKIAISYPPSYHYYVDGK